MSFLPINEQNQQAPQGQTTPAPAIGGPPPQTSGTAGASPGTPPKGSATGSPTQFGSSASKLGDYLSANAPQITDQANTIAGNLNQTYGNVSQGITNAANQFGQQVQGGYTANNPDLINQAIQNPVTFASDPNNVKGFQSLYNDQYTGPLAFEGTTPYSDIQNQVSQAVQQGNLLGTQAGLQSYLQGQGTNPTRASSTLDALLLQGNPDAQATIRNAAGQLGNLSGQFQTATQGANQSVLAAQQAAQNAQAYAQGQFNPYVQNFANQLTTGAANADKDRTAYNASLNNFYSQATPVEQAINAWLGQLNPNAWPNDPNRQMPKVTDLFQDAITKNALVSNPITAQNFSTPEQYAQAQAIQQLVGNTAQLPIGQDTVSQAGTAPTITPANLPTIQSLLEAYGPTLGAASWAGTGGVNTGFPNLQNELTSQGNLLNYLNQFDPNYYATKAAPGQFGAGTYWGEGADYNFPGWKVKG